MPFKRPSRYLTGSKVGLRFKILHKEEILIKEKIFRTAIRQIIRFDWRIVCCENCRQRVEHTEAPSNKLTGSIFV